MNTQENIKPIRYLKIRDEGSFSVNIEVFWEYSGDRGIYTPENLSKSTDGKYYIDLVKKVPENSIIYLQCNAFLGKNCISKEKFIVKNKCVGEATYKIIGSTLKNKLKLDSYIESK